MKNKHPIDRLIAGMNRVDFVVMVIAQLLLAAMVVITFVSVLGRTFLHVSVPDDLLFQEMLMVAVVFLPLSYVQSVGGHLEVTVLSDRFSKKVQTALIGLGLVLALMIFSWMAYLSFKQAIESYSLGEVAYGSVLYIPEWPAKALIPLGLAWWSLRILLQIMFTRARPNEAQNELRQALDSSVSHNN